jgi:hypothetical protein
MRCHIAFPRILQYLMNEKKNRVSSRSVTPKASMITYNNFFMYGTERMTFDNILYEAGKSDLLQYE